MTTELNSTTLAEIERYKKRTTALTVQFEKYAKVCTQMNLSRVQALEHFLIQQVAAIQLSVDHLLKITEDFFINEETEKESQKNERN